LYQEPVDGFEKSSFFPLAVSMKPLDILASSACIILALDSFESVETWLNKNLHSKKAQ
jgi:hypothetical protein